jgi:hypothetical protein
MINDASYTYNDVKNITWQAKAWAASVVAAYRKTDSGRRTRINANLPKATRKLAG